MIKIRKDNSNLLNRLYNYKFEQALEYLKKESIEVKEDVRLLARMFGDCGWIDGDMDGLIQTALDSLGLWELIEEKENE